MRSFASYSEEALVIALQQGDPLAFRCLYTNSHQALLRIITQIVQDPVEAQDLLQDTYVKIWRRIRHYKPRGVPLISWLNKVARNTALDFVRQAKPQHLSLPVELYPTPISLIGWSVIDDGYLRQTVSQRLKPCQWQVVELFYWQGYTHEQIAGRLTIPLGTVKSRISQSLSSLKPVLT